MPETNEPMALEEVLRHRSKKPTPLVGGGLLYARTKMVIYGRYKALKSMIGLDMAFALATGREWLGFSTPPTGTSVFYLQLEIPFGLLRTRLAKTWQFREQEQPLLKPIHFWTQHWLKLDQSAGLKQLEHYMEEYKPAVLIVDPLYKVISGNLLNAIDMQRVIDSLDTLIGRYGVSVVVISHTRKGMMDMGEWGSDDLIGSVFLSAWVDTAVKVERRGGDKLGIKFDIVRHAETELEQQEVGFNRDTLTFTPVQTLQPGKDGSKEEK